MTAGGQAKPGAHSRQVERLSEALMLGGARLHQEMERPPCFMTQRMAQVGAELRGGVEGSLRATDRHLALCDLDQLPAQWAESWETGHNNNNYKPFESFGFFKKSTWGIRPLP